MAEYVHQTVEEMIPELEEMNRIGLFSTKETKIILKTRESHEYKLRQLTKTKKSFLNYVQYEQNLLELIKIRRKKLGLGAKKHNIEKSIADRIHNLYRLVTTRFPEDLSLWEKHIEFSRLLDEKAYVTRLYDRALKVHSHNSGLWVRAAKWESDKHGNSNPSLAREILLKGQRVNPESQEIYLQMFLMELTLASLVAKRKDILGIAEPQVGDSSNGAEEDKRSEFKLAEIVYSKGVELFPGNAEFHLKLLYVCSSVREAADLLKMVVADLLRLYPDNPQVWNGLALRHLNNYHKLDTDDERRQALAQCMEVYQQAVQAVPTETMWSLCLKSHLKFIQLGDPDNAVEITTRTLELFEQALQQGCLSEHLYVSLLELLQDLSATEDLARVAVSGCEQHKGSARLWLARLKAASTLAPDGSGDAPTDVWKLVNLALKRVPDEESWPIWEFGLNHAALTHHAGLEQLMERACRSVCPNVCKPAKVWCLHWTLRQGGIKGARNVYKKLKSMRPISLDFYRLYIQAECSQMEPNFLIIRSVFEEALVEFGQSCPDLWLNYIEMERTVAKDAVKSGAVHQRALNNLDLQLKESYIRKHAMVTAMSS